MPKATPTRTAFSRSGARSRLQAASSVKIINRINGGSDDGVFWQVGSSATLGTTTDVRREYSRAHQHHPEYRRNNFVRQSLGANAAVTMDTNTITNNNTVEDSPADRRPRLQRLRLCIVDTPHYAPPGLRPYFIRGIEVKKRGQESLIRHNRRILQGQGH